MDHGLEPTEQSDGRVTVHVLGDDGTREREPCRTYADAVETARAAARPERVVKIEDRDGEVVFSSAEMDLSEWETEWRHACRRLSVAVERRECPYDDVSCVADDRCPRCEMDAMRERA